MQIPISTPTPSAGQVVEQATRIIDTWNSLGPLMAVLAVAALALGVVALIQWGARNSNSTALTVIANSNLQKDKEIAELKAQREQDRTQNIESLSVISEQMNRQNDIGDKTNSIMIMLNARGVERDAQQAKMIEIQGKMAEDLRVIASTGSKPVLTILQRVQEIAELVSKMDTRTADWNTILTTINPLLTELSAYRQEAKKHSTQPIPAVAPENPPEALPS